MYRPFALLILVVILACNGGKQEGNTNAINSNILLSIINKGSLNDFEKLVNNGGYLFTDTILQDGYLIYWSKDILTQKDKLNAHVAKDNRVVFISLEVHDINFFSELRKQFISKGFVSARNEFNIEQLKKMGTSTEILLMKSEGKPGSYTVFIGNQP